MIINGTNYLVEPLIRYFKKYTSNNGWIADAGWAGEAMEAFSHYTYHRLFVIYRDAIAMIPGTDQNAVSN
jgi:Alpha-kinase family